MSNIATNIITEVKIDRIVWYNPQNKWGVLGVETPEELKKEFIKNTFTVTGNFENLYEGAKITLTGVISDHPRYGKQIVMESYKIVVEKDNKESIINFLSRSAIKGISIQNAVKIYNKYKEKSIETTLNNPDKLIEINGIGEKTIQKIKDSTKQYKEMEDVIEYCTQLGFKYSLIYKLHIELGKKLLPLLKENIYSILDYTDNISFKQIDTIALNNGGSHDDINRQKYCFLYLLKLHVIYLGSTGIKYQDLKNLFSKELGCSDSNSFNSMCQTLKDEEYIYVENNRIYYKKYYDLEKSIAGRLLTLVNNNKEELFDVEVIKHEIKNFPYQLNKQQIQAVINSLKHRLCVILGQAGTGKSTISKALVNIYSQHNYNVVLLSPTGKASRRLEECVGLPAQTIHKFLGIKTNITDVDNIKKVPPKTVIFIDETSMVDILIFDKLLECFNTDTRLALIGDWRQLSSVGVGSLFSDIIESEKVFVSELTDIMRQAKDSNIIANCFNINEGIIIEEQNKEDFMYFKFNNRGALEKSFLTFYDSEYNKRDLQDIQVLTCYKKESLGSIALNKLLSSKYNKNELNEKFGFRVSDKVIHNRNNYNKGVMNGETGIISNIDEDFLTVDYGGVYIEYTTEDIDELDLAYVCTVHKSQGSEYPIVFFIIDNYTNMLLIRRLVYTAVSRGKSKVYVLAMEDSLTHSILNSYNKPRNTTLKKWLQQSN